MTRPSRAHLVSAACLAAAAALGLHALGSARRFEEVSRRENIPALADAAEAAARATELAGTYATGSQPGDRVIRILAPARIEFSEVGRPAGAGVIADTFTLGRRGRQLCLLPGAGEPVEVVNLDTLVYYRDTYRRR